MLQNRLNFKSHPSGASCSTCLLTLILHCMYTKCILRLKPWNKFYRKATSPIFGASYPRCPLKYKVVLRICPVDDTFLSDYTKISVSSHGFTERSYFKKNVTCLISDAPAWDSPEQDSSSIRESKGSERGGFGLRLLVSKMSYNSLTFKTFTDSCLMNFSLHQLLWWPNIVHQVVVNAMGLTLNVCGSSWVKYRQGHLVSW